MLLAATTSFNPLWIVALFIPAFALLWILVNFILYRVGWIHLQFKYRWQFPIEAQRYGVISIRFRKVNYNNMIIAFADKQGFYLHPVFMFRMFNKPVFIPWTEVREITQERMMFIRFTSVKIGTGATETIHFTRNSFKKLEVVFRENLKPQYFNNLN